MASTPRVVEIELIDLEGTPRPEHPPEYDDHGGPSSVGASYAAPPPLPPHPLHPPAPTPQPVPPAPVVLLTPPSPIRSNPNVAPVPARAAVEEQPEQSIHIKNVIFAILSVVSFSHAWDATCICVALPTIASDLDATVSQTLGLATSFLLAVTIAQPVYLEFSELVGRKPGYLSALALFIVGTVTCGLARSSAMLMAGRVIQGIGAAGPQALSPMIITDLFPSRQRALYLSFLNVSWAVGTVVGPVLGGFFTQKEIIGWRWIFWFNIPILTAGLTISYGLMPSRPPCTLGQIVQRIDFRGILLFASFGVFFLLPLSWGGSRHPWYSINVVVPLVFASVLLALLVWHVNYVQRPLFRPSVFRNRSTVLQLINTTLHGMLMWMVLYYMSVFYLGVKGFSPAKTGIFALPATVTVMPLAIGAGLLVRQTGSYRVLLYVGWAITIAIFGILMWLNEHVSNVCLLLLTVSLGVGIGILVPALTCGVLATAANRDAGHAVAMVYVLRSAGQCLGVAVGLAVFSSRLEVELRTRGYDEATAHFMMQNMKHSLSRDAASNGVVIEAVVSALRVVWTVGCCVAFIAGILTIAARCPPVPTDQEGPSLRGKTRYDEEA